MTTNLDIIKRGMRKIHVLASGAEPTTAQAVEGMSALQSLIVELIGQGSLGRLNDVLATSAYTAKEFDRVQASAGVVVTLPTTISTEYSDYPYVGGSWPQMGPAGGYDYGAGYAVTPRPPLDRATIVVITDNVPVYNVWRTYTNEWVAINSLTQQDSFPFADYLENGFAAMLAEATVDNFDGGEVGAETKRQANGCRAMLSLKMDSASRPAAACFF